MEIDVILLDSMGGGWQLLVRGAKVRHVNTVRTNGHMQLGYFKRVTDLSDSVEGVVQTVLDRLLPRCIVSVKRPSRVRSWATPKVDYR